MSNDTKIIQTAIEEFGAAVNYMPGGKSLQRAVAALDGLRKLRVRMLEAENARPPRATGALAPPCPPQTVAGVDTNPATSPRDTMWFYPAVSAVPPQRHTHVAREGTDGWDEVDAIRQAIEPVIDWYQSDEEHPRLTLDIIKDIVADLQSDRAEVLRLRRKSNG